MSHAPLYRIDVQFTEWLKIKVPGIEIKPGVFNQGDDKLDERILVYMTAGTSGGITDSYLQKNPFSCLCQALTPDRAQDIGIEVFNAINIAGGTTFPAVITPAIPEKSIDLIAPIGQPSPGAKAGKYFTWILLFRLQYSLMEG